MRSQTSIFYLPPEILKMIFQNFTSTQDISNFSIALAGSLHEEFVTHEFLKPQLKMFASLDLNLKKHLKNEGWFEDCQDTKLIIRLTKKFYPFRPGMTFKI